MLRIISRIGLITLCLFFLTTTSLSQSATPNSQSATTSPSPDGEMEPATPAPSPQVEILYTGRLLGYFRVPSLQSGKTPKYSGCPATSIKNDSAAATLFLQKRQKYSNAILVGAGDNFAPQLEARVFFPPPDDSTKKGKYHPRNKELYYGDDNRWLPYDDDKTLSKDLRDKLAEGRGTIPNDNVGCFLAAAGYAAVVPGKHDFYFGVERVRQLARLMASFGDNSPQMLGANLVLKTEPFDAGDPQPNKGKPEWLDDWPDKYPVLNVPGSVYPWLSYVRIKIADINPKASESPLSGFTSKLEKGANEQEVLDFLKGREDQEAQKLHQTITSFSEHKFYVCVSHGSPNEITKPGVDCDRVLTDKKIRLVGNRLVYEVSIDRKINPKPEEGQSKNAMTLEHSRNYGFCLFQKEKKKVPCHRFSVYTPFFSYPHDAPTSVKGTRDKFIDPAPFVFLQKYADRPSNEDVAIFGVVDPTLGRRVGVLNFAWRNRNDNYKTDLSVEDPAQALQEQVDYFESWYEKEKKEPFKGLRIMLAQMSPQQARLFAARVPGFQVIVTAADQEQATNQLDQSVTWSSDNRASAFVAVPAPYFDTQKQKGFVIPGVLEASPGKENSWSLKSVVSPSDGGIEERAAEDLQKDSPKITMKDFSTRLEAALKDCLPEKFQIPFGKQTDQLKLLTLCAMRKRTNADVVLVQQRDFFDLPLKALEESIEVQLYLDRFIWKGDLLTLMYVPGSAIREALKRSKEFEAEERSVLTLVDERGRGFEQLGIRYDSNRNEYLINEIAIDDTKIYAVATSDYIGAGDTGYPELAGAALNPRTHPREFPRALEPISSIVCRQLFLRNPSNLTGKSSDFCLPSLITKTYLDESVATPVPTYQQRSFGSKFVKLLPFNKPRKLKAAESSGDALQERVERRPIWTFSLRNLSFSVTSLTNNLTDDEIGQKFGGIPSSGIEAKKNRDLVLGLDTRITRSAHSHEYFLASGMEYHEIITGDSPLNQVANLLTFDAGIIWRWPGRSIPHWAPVFSLHTETQLRQPVTTFDLGTKDSLRISQDRRWLLLPRLGLRWQNRGSTLELGAQAGRAINSLAGYRFDTGGVITECLLDSATTLADCITANSTSPNINITKDSIASPILHNRPRAGIYWYGGFAIKFHSKVKYEFEDKGDFFFNFHGDNVTDTRFRDLSKHRLSFSIFPSLSIGPALHLLLYQNKINNDFLAQKTFTIETKVSFELFNRREKGVQLKNKP